MSDYLLTGAVSNALNSPSVTADEAPKLKPFVALAERLGAFAGQMVDVGLKAIDIAYEGEVSAINVKPLTATALAGLLRPMLAEVNMVSAPAVAKERGITLSESRQDDSPIFDSLMRITVTTQLGQALLRRHPGRRARPARGREVKGMELERAVLAGHALRQQSGQAGLHRRARRPARRRCLASISPPSTSAVGTPARTPSPLSASIRRPTRRCSTG